MTDPTTPRPDHPAWNGDMGPCVCSEHRADNQRHLPTTPRPDPVTEARDALLAYIFGGVTGGSAAQRTESMVDALIAAVEARAAALRPTPPPAVDGTREVSPEQVARAFHEAYERLAPEYGYQTRRQSAVPWDMVPDENRRLMVATVQEVRRTIGFPFTPPAPDTDRLRALEALATEIGRILDTEWPEYVDHLVAGTTPSLLLDYIRRDLAAARALLADGEAS